MHFTRPILTLCLMARVCAQTSPTLAPQEEIGSKDSPVTFKSGVNLVPATVVVRDNKGHAAGNLTADDFQLFDNGKPQMISKFTVEKLATGEPAPPSKTTTPAAKLSGQDLAATDSDGIPDHFVAYLFDDVHMKASDLHYTRDAARRQIDASLHPLDRAAIYTTSGHQKQEFTGDREKLHAALTAMNPGQASAAKSMEQNSCPPVTYYMADLIANKNDDLALKIVTQDTLFCLNVADPGLDPLVCNTPGTNSSSVAIEYCSAVRMAQSASRRAVVVGEQDSESTLETLRSVVSRMSAMPGRRSIVLVSPGFLVTDDRLDEETGLIDRAIKANIVIGALDVRGLYAQVPAGDASQGRANSSTLTAKIIYTNSEANAQADVMEILSSGTGGAFYENSNDLDAGFARVATAPEYLYVLGFSPLDLKLDGHHHSLKVTLKGIKGMDIEARKGYDAPRFGATPAEQAKQQIEEAFFSREEMHELPAALLTQYFKSDNGDATLSTVAKVDVKKLSYHKEGNRNRNDITVVTGLFDNDGNYVTGEQKTVEMRLLDRTLQNRLVSGISVESSFTVHPGRYVVRMVVRDTEGQVMAAQSSMVEIP